MDNTSNSSNICGVFPYIAAEHLQTGNALYSENHAYNYLRPGVAIGTPRCLN